MRDIHRTLAALGVVSLAGCVGPSTPPPTVCPPCQCASAAPQAAPATAQSSPPLAPPPAPGLVLVPEASTPPQAAISGEIVAPPAPASDAWSLFHGSPTREGVSAAPHITRPRIRWTAEIGIQGWLNAPLVVGRHVIAPSSGASHNQPDPRDGVFALDLATGRIAWQAHFDQDANGAAVAGDRVIATSDDGFVHGLDLRTGASVWKQQGRGKMYTTPLVVGDVVVTGDAQGYVRAFQWRDGTPRWSVQMNGAIRGGAASDGQRIYAVSQGGEAIALMLDGTVVWRTNLRRPGFGSGVPVPLEGYAAPVVSGGVVYVPFARDTYYDRPAIKALDARTGRTRWSAPETGSDTWGNIRMTPALVDGLLIYPEPYSGDIAAIESSRGAVRWRRTVGRCLFPSYAAPAAAGDVVYVPRFDGVLYAVRSADGGVLWRMYLGDAGSAATVTGAAGSVGRDCGWDTPSGAPLYSPVGIAPDGTVLSGNGAGTLFAIEESR